MHNSMPKAVAILNAVADFVLLLLAFFLAGVFRMWLPFGSKFFMIDLSRFFPIAVIYAVVMVLCYAGTNCYHSLHCSGLAKEGFKVAVINVLGLALVGTALFTFRLSQFSRLLLLYFYIMTTILVLIKRIVVDKLATAHERRKNLHTDVLIIGSADTAKRYYSDVVQKKILKCIMWDIWTNNLVTLCRIILEKQMIFAKYCSLHGWTKLSLHRIRKVHLNCVRLLQSPIPTKLMLQ